MRRLVIVSSWSALFAKVSAFVWMVESIKAKNCLSYLRFMNMHEYTFFASGSYFNYHQIKKGQELALIGIQSVCGYLNLTSLRFRTN